MTLAHPRGRIFQDKLADSPERVVLWQAPAPLRGGLGPTACPAPKGGPQGGVHACGGVGASLTDFFDDFARRHLVGVAADAATRQQVLHCGILGRFFFCVLRRTILVAAAAGKQGERKNK